MKVGELLTAEKIAIGEAAEDRDAVIKRLVELVCVRGFVTKKEKLLKAITDRESEGSTGVGGGIAIPHCMTVAVKKPLLFGMTLEKPVDFDSYDGKPVDMVFMIASPDNGDKSGMEVMSSLSLLLTDDEFAGNLRKAGSPEEFLDMVNAAESGEKTEVKKSGSSKKKNKLAAVCACPNGIAKGPLAAGALEKAAEKSGCVIKVEKRGSKGSTDVLSAGDIADAKAVIIASDIDVPMERFDGKRVVRVTTDECIKSPADYIEQAVSGGVSQFDAAKAKKESGVKTGKSATPANRGIAGFIAMILPFFTGAAVLALFAGVIKLMGYGGAIYVDINNSRTFATMIIAAVVTGFVAGLIAGDEGMAVGFFGCLLVRWGQIFGARISVVSIVMICVTALVIAAVAGALVLLLKKIFSGIPAKLTWLKNIILIPLTGCIISEVLVWFAVNPLVALIAGTIAK
ncbi:MAG: PTS sugar transporter subunit IIA [Lachnospiraceae bacterium]|nr:PTS sugar transporter subunit IIA [Lachnospiraceae bacterium]